MRYRKIDPRVWGDEKFRVFTDDGKLAFLYLLTHPHMTALGAMRSTLGGLAAEMGWSPRRFERAIRPAITAGMIEVNERVAFVGLPNFLKYNQPENPNVAKAWISALDLIPECDERAAVIARARASLTGPFREGFEEAFRKAFGEGLGEAFGKGVAKGMPIPEPEPEPEPEQKPEQEGASPLPPFKSTGVSSNGGRTGRPSRKRVDHAWGRR